MNLISSWSAGKDSCYALMLAIEGGHTPKVLLNMMNENGKISRSHGLPLSILNQQSETMNIPIKGIATTWGAYEEKYVATLLQLKEIYNVDGVVFGDIDLEQHRTWEEKVCKQANLQAHLPLWQQDRRKLVFEMIDKGIKAIITSCNLQLGEPFLGREITKSLVEELEAIGVDACGENGEYHTVVVDCPLFSKSITLPTFKKVIHENYCFLVWD